MLVDEDELINQIELDDHRTLFVAPSRIIVYRESSLLAEESVDTYSTDVERLLLDEGKKQVTVTFEYADEDDHELQLPPETMANALKALLASVVRTNGVVDEDESIRELFRFNEMTVILTDRRVIQHLGTSLWADAHNSIEYEDIRDIRTEEGTISTGVIIETTESAERLKIPQDAADRFVELLDQSVCEFHDVASLGVLRGDPNAGEPDPEPDLDRLRPLQVGDEYDSGDGSQPATDSNESVSNKEVLSQLDELSMAIERQQELLERTRRTIEQLEQTINRDQ